MTQAGLRAGPSPTEAKAGPCLAPFPPQTALTAVIHPEHSSWGAALLRSWRPQLRCWSTTSNRARVPGTFLHAAKPNGKSWAGLAGTQGCRGAEKGDPAPTPPYTIFPPAQTLRCGHTQPGARCFLQLLSGRAEGAGAARATRCSLGPADWEGWCQPVLRAENGFQTRCDCTLIFFFPSQKRLSDDVKFFTPIVLHWVCVPITLLLSPSSPSFLVDKASFTHVFAILCLF